MHSRCSCSRAAWRSSCACARERARRRTSTSSSEANPATCSTRSTPPSPSFQIAQKLHAVSERPVDRTNDRFRDLVDLLVLRELVSDLPALRAACETTFATRATHAWPPSLDVPATWQAGYARLAGEVGLDVVRVDDAAARVREFIAAITSAQ